MTTRFGAAKHYVPKILAMLLASLVTYGSTVDPVGRLYMQLQNGVDVHLLAMLCLCSSDCACSDVPMW